jgi:hypothetical protein
MLDAALVLIGAGLAVLIAQAALTSATDADRPPWPARLSHDPLDLPALRALGLRLDSEGRLDEADAVLAFVGRRTWRDGPTEVWLLRRRLDQDRYGEAFESADSLLRRDADGTTRPALFALFVAAADDVEARPALVARLAAAPWWRRDFLRVLGAQGGVPGARAVFSALARGPAPPAADEYAPLIDRLASAGDYTGAYDAWRSVAGRSTRETSATGGVAFSGVSDGTPFTWRPAGGVGASSEFEPASTGEALRVDYDGYSSPNLPARLFVAPPDQFVLSWRQKLDPAAPERLFWRVRCAGSGLILARAPPAGSGWRAVAITVRTPATGCAAQWFELAATPGERRAPVTAWYAALSARRAR